MNLRIKSICEAKGVKVADIADKIGMSRPNLYNIVNGKLNPPINTLEKIAAALGVELWQLFTPASAKPVFSAHIHIEYPQYRDFCVYSYEDFKTVAATLEQIMNPDNGK